jgi:GT2 family glycosyltransferase
MKRPDISVVIAAYNDLERLKILLGRLYQTKAKNFEVVVVDDASKEDLKSLTKFFPIRYFRNSKNLGAAETRNLAARKAKGEILLSLDNDVLPQTDLVWQVERFFQKNPFVIAVTGFAGTGVENPTFFAQYKYLRDWAYWYLDLDQSRFCFFRPAIGAIRKDVFLKLKGYDKRYCRPGVPAVEDLEFSYRLAKQGKIVFDPKLVVGHPFGGLKKLVKTYFDRTGLFMEILKEYELFSGVATTPAEAATIILAPLCLGALILTLLYPHFWPFFLFTLLAFIYRQRLFLRLCWQRQGWFFAFKAFLTSWLLYLVIIVGTIYYIFRPIGLLIKALLK